MHTDFFARARTLTRLRGEKVYMAGEVADMVYLLDTGLVRCDVLTAEGRVMAAGLVRPGELLGEAALFRRRHSTFAQVVVDSNLTCIPIADFHGALQRAPQLAYWVADILGRRILATNALADALNRRAAPARMAALLLSLVDGAHGHVAGLSHQDLGDMIGVYRETATHILNAFRRLGMVALRPRHVDVLRPKLLRQVANDSRRRSVLAHLAPAERA